jgi:riboflavin synthase
MFTGLIQSRGKIRGLADDRVEILIDPAKVEIILADLEIGDSIAVDGVCLTAERLLGQGFVAAVSPETWQRSTLGQNVSNATRWVNLETSLRAGGKIGGHFVTGHVDGWGQLAEVQQSAAAWELKFTLPPPQSWQEPLAQPPGTGIAKYIVAKGSIAVNGISLTVANCGADWFTVAVIPHTYAETNLNGLTAGNLVNLEGDILSKYVEKLLHPGSQAEDISLDFLTSHGYG